MFQASMGWDCHNCGSVFLLGYKDLVHSHKYCTSCGEWLIDYLRIPGRFVKIDW